MQHRNIYLKIGLIISLGSILWLFEWKTESPKVVCNLPSPDLLEETIDTTTNAKADSLPATVRGVSDTLESKPLAAKLPPVQKKQLSKPKKQKQDTLEMEDIIIEEEDIPVELEEVALDTIPEEEDVWICTLGSESWATPKGGMTAFLERFHQRIKYPRKAKRKGIEGRVFVQFTISQNGELGDIEVLRGIGGGCDEESIRVLQNDSTKWEPGRQRGRPVKQRMTMPILFRLK